MMIGPINGASLVAPKLRPVSGQNSGSAAEVTPVSEIGSYTFQPGAITKTLMDDYSAEVQPKSKAA